MRKAAARCATARVRAAGGAPGQQHQALPSPLLLVQALKFLLLPLAQLETCLRVGLQGDLCGRCITRACEPRFRGRRRGPGGQGPRGGRGLAAEPPDRHGRQVSPLRIADCVRAIRAPLRPRCVFVLLPRSAQAAHRGGQRTHRETSTDAAKRSTATRRCDGQRARTACGPRRAAASGGCGSVTCAPGSPARSPALLPSLPCAVGSSRLQIWEAQAMTTVGTKADKAYPSGTKGTPVS